jgi:hypothetical protein
MSIWHLDMCYTCPFHIVTFLSIYLEFSIPFDAALEISGVTRNERTLGKNCVMGPPYIYFYFKG